MLDTKIDANGAFQHMIISKFNQIQGIPLIMNDRVSGLKGRSSALVPVRRGAFSAILTLNFHYRPFHREHVLSGTIEKTGSATRKMGCISSIAHFTQKFSPAYFCRTS